MVVANSKVDQITIYFGDGNGIFPSSFSYSTGFGSTPYMVAVDDINNDTYADIVVANFGTNNIAIFLGYGNGTFSNHTAISTNSSRPLWITIADLNNDTALDIITANYGTDSISIFDGCGNGTFYHSITYSMGYDSLVLSIAVGDLNNDNHLDFITANFGTNNIDLFLSNGNGTFENHAILSTGLKSHPYSVVVGYLNEDTMLDIAVANHGVNNISVFFGYGNGTFTKQTTYSTGTASPYFIGIGDLNEDNRLDLVVSNKGTNDVGVFVGSTDSTFTLSKMYSTGSTSSISFALGDLNKDHRLDLIVISNDTHTINILLGIYEGLSDQTTYSTGYYPSAVAVGDLNNDTRLDIVVANLE